MSDKCFQEGEEFIALRDELSGLLAQAGKLSGDSPSRPSIKHRADELFSRYQQLERMYGDDVSRDDRVEVSSIYAQIIRSTSNIPYIPTIGQELHYRRDINHNPPRETPELSLETQKSAWSL